MAGYFVKSSDDNEYALRVSSPSSTSEGLYVYGSTVATGTKSAAIETSEGVEEIFSVESPEVEIYSSGSAGLTGGQTSVTFDRLFTEAVSADVEVRVTVTPVGAWSALYLESTGPEGFDVKSAAGDQNVAFHWMACGRRKGYETRPISSALEALDDERLLQLKEEAYEHE